MILLLTCASVFAQQTTGTISGRVLDPQGAAIPGALIGIIGAMFVRYWFAARRLGFAIHRDGTIVPLVGPSSGRLKRVAGGAFAP